MCAAAAFAAAALTDASGLYMPLIAAGWIFLLGVRSRNVPRALAKAALLVGCFAALLAPWAYRNYLENPAPRTLSSPFVENRVEKDVMSRNLWAEVHGALAHHPEYVTLALRQFFVVPFNISLLDQYTHVRYADIALSITSGQERYPELSIQQVFIFSAKLLFTLLHLLVIGCAFAALFMRPTRRIALLWLLAVGYVFVAAVAVGVLTPDFAGISPLNSFLFPLMPLAFICAAPVAIRVWHVIRHEYA